MRILIDLLQNLLGLGPWITMVQSNDYSMLRTGGGFFSAIGPLLGLILVAEIVRALWTNTFRVRQYRAIFLIYFFNRTVSLWISLGVGVFLLGLLTPMAPFSLGTSWYGLIYGYIVWELGHYIYHYLAHKVRLYGVSIRPTMHRKT